MAAAAAAVIGMGGARADGLDDVATAPFDTNDALVLIPAANQEYADVANALYLAPNGFDGDATVFITPDVGNEVANVGPGVQALVQTIEADYSAGDLSAADPLYVFGYSEGAVEEGLAEQQLAADGIPAADLNFVMVGDSASAEGGFLNTFIDSLPESSQQSTTELLAQMGVTPPVLGATTPDDLYPTEVYSLTGDGWPNYDDGANIYGMFTEHLEYLGLTPAEISSATETTEGMTDYFTIDSASVNNLSALYDQFLLALGISPPNAADTVDAAATSAGVSTDTAYPFELLNDAATNLTDANQVLAGAPAGDLAAMLATQLDTQDTALQLLGDLDTAQTTIAAFDNGALADLVTPFFNTVDQGWASATETLLNADQALDAALTSGSGVEAADFTVIAADLGLTGDAFNAFSTDLVSQLF